MYIPPLLLGRLNPTSWTFGKVVMRPRCVRGSGLLLLCSILWSGIAAEAAADSAGDKQDAAEKTTKSLEKMEQRIDQLNQLIRQREALLMDLNNELRRTEMELAQVQQIAAREKVKAEAKRQREEFNATRRLEELERANLQREMDIKEKWFAMEREETELEERERDGSELRERAERLELDAMELEIKGREMELKARPMELKASQMELKAGTIELERQMLQSRRVRLELLSDPVFVASTSVDSAMEFLPRERAVKLLQGCMKESENPTVRQLIRTKLLEHHLKSKDFDAATELMRDAILLK